MPRKYQDDSSANLKAIVGKAALYINVNAQIKELEEQKTELRNRLLRDIKTHGEVIENGNIVFEEGPVRIILNTQVRESFLLDQAMSVLHQLSEEEALAYTKVITDKELIASAYMQGKISQEDVQKCFSEKTVEVLRVEKVGDE